MQTDPAAAAPAVRPPPAPLAALAGWLVPGAGYWLIGQRARAVTVCVTIVLLFVAGLLIGGIRVLEVPYYDKLGQKVQNAELLSEVRSKPWSVAQVMTGPLGIVSGYFAVQASQPNPNTDELIYDAPEGPLNPRRPYGAESHARVNEIAVLYTAVAGMLNLLTMIDAAHRAEKLLGQRNAAMNVMNRAAPAAARGARQ